MRFIVIVKATKDSEAGVLPDKKILTEMGKFNEELVKAGVMLAGEGLQPSSKGVRVRFSGNKRTVIDGPFTETKELIAGFWLWQVKSKEEAIEWIKRAPFTDGDEVEIRQVFEAADFGAEFTPELREQEERLRAEIEKQKADLALKREDERLNLSEAEGTLRKTTLKLDKPADIVANAPATEGGSKTPTICWPSSAMRSGGTRRQTKP